MESGNISLNVISIALAALLLLCIVELVLLIVLFTKHRRQKRRIDEFLMGADGKNLESVIVGNIQKVRKNTENIEDAFDDIENLRMRQRAAYQKVGIVKYDAYAENGGQLSFAVALLDEDDNGILLNVMNSREGSFSYIKEIREGVSAIALGEEESEALYMAKDAKRKKNVRH